jgi:hypothetical protein
MLHPKQFRKILGNRYGVSRGILPHVLTFNNDIGSNDESVRGISRPHRYVAARYLLFPYFTQYGKWLKNAGKFSEAAGLTPIRLGKLMDLNHPLRIVVGENKGISGL